MTTTTIDRPVGLLEQIVAWENGELDEFDEADFFQTLINTGLAWSLQGCYGRRAQQLIDEGACYV